MFFCFFFVLESKKSFNGAQSLTAKGTNRDHILILVLTPLLVDNGLSMNQGCSLGTASGRSPKKSCTGTMTVCYKGERLLRICNW